MWRCDLNIIRQIRQLSFAEFYFRLVTMIFWPIYWYTLTVITIKNLTITLFYIFTILDTLFMILIIWRFIRKKIQDRRYFIFAFSMSVTYMVSLMAVMIYKQSVELVYLEILMCSILIFVSVGLIKKSKNDIGMVGILTGVLILVLTYFY